MTPDRDPPPDTFPDDWLSAFLDGELDSQQRKRAARLLELNSVTARKLEEVASVRQLVRSLPQVLSIHKPQNPEVIGSPAAFENRYDLLTSTVPDRPLSNLDDGLEIIQPTETKPIPSFSAKVHQQTTIRSWARPILAIAACLLGLVVVGSTLWVLDYSQNRPLLSQGKVGVSEPDQLSSNAIQPAPAAPSAIVLDSGGTLSSELPSATSELPSATSELKVADSLPSTFPNTESKLSNAGDASGNSSLDWLLQEGLNRAARFDLASNDDSEAEPLSDSAQATLPGSEPAIAIVEPAMARTGSQNSGSVNWYRASNWSDFDVVSQQNAHPMLQTLQEFQPFHQDAVQNRNTAQLSRQAAGRIDPSGLMPLAVLRIPLDRSQWVDQVVQKWQVTPEWTAPDESIRVLFVYAEKLSELENRLQTEGDSVISWLRPPSQTNGLEKNILVIHFYTSDQPLDKREGEKRSGSGRR